MAIADSIPVRFTPRGLADAYDSTDVFPGACRLLQNLVFDQSNPEVVIPRPGVGTALTSFAGFTSPGFVSVQITIGQYVYGMVSTGLTAGKDQPFCYDLKGNAFVAVSGCTAGNAEKRPASPATSGAWTPPTMTVVGSKIIITHPGYTGLSGDFFGVIDISNPLAPAYTTANTAGNALPSVPTSVANLNNRAYFACKNVVYFSDVLVPTTITSSTQSLTVGDTTPVLALSGLPVQTTTAGVVSALLAFKGTQIWQITGDAAVSGSLALNYLSLNIGCMAPRTIVPSPLGTFFVGPDACYLVTAMGVVQPVTNGRQVPDISQPFAYVTTPSRAAAAFAGNIYRVCLPTIIDGVAGTFDYWFDTRKMRWTGPHTFVYDCASSAGTYFVVTGAPSTGKLFVSNVFPNTTTVYNDNAVPFTCTLKSADFSKSGQMAMVQVVESTVELSSSGQPITYSIVVFDDSGNQLSAATVVTPSTGSQWGSNVWGDGSRWASALNQPKTYQIDWNAPLVFNRISVQISMAAALGEAIGTFFARAKKTGYLLQ